MGQRAPAQLYYRGSLAVLSRFTLAVISADSISGVAMMATNQLLFTIRDYEMNYIGGWHSVMEAEIFRLGLYRRHTTVTLFTAKGLLREDHDTFLETRFHPPLHEFPERKEYFRRAAAGELPMISIASPLQGKMIMRNVMMRNLVSCMLADAVFVPHAAAGTKTYATVERVLAVGVPVFTTEHESNAELHLLGVQTHTRKSVGRYLESLGARLPVAGETQATVPAGMADSPRVSEPAQQWLLPPVKKGRRRAK